MEEQVAAVDTVAASSGCETPSDGSDRPSSAVTASALPAGAAPAVPSTAAAAAASGSRDLNVGSGSDSKPQASRRTTTLEHRVRRAESGLRYS
eukprot:1348316-Prymnesium_polylepis.1